MEVDSCQTSSVKLHLSHNIKYIENINYDCKKISFIDLNTILNH